MENKNRIAERLNGLEKTPPPMVWDKVEAGLNGKKKAAWFPMLVAAVFLGLLGLSAMVYMQNQQIRGIRPELEQQLLPQEQPNFSPIYQPELNSQEEEVNTNDAELEQQASSVQHEKPSAQAKTIQSVQKKEIDPFVEPVGSLNVDPQQEIKAKNVQVKVSKIRSEKSTAKEILAKLDPDRIKPESAVKQLKKYKNPENWNLPQVEIRLPSELGERLPKLFNNEKPKTDNNE